MQMDIACVVWEKVSPQRTWGFGPHHAVLSRTPGLLLARSRLRYLQIDPFSILLSLCATSYRACHVHVIVSVKH